MFFCFRENFASENNVPSDLKENLDLKEHLNFFFEPTYFGINDKIEMNPITRF